MKNKTEVKAKEPVKLRFRELKNGNKSLYLECYTGSIVRNGSSVGGKHTYEFLKLYLIPENSKEEKQRNKETLALAKAIQSKRIVEYQNRNYGFINREQSRYLLSDFVNKMLNESKNEDSKNYKKVIMNVLGKLKDFRGNNILLQDINKVFLDDFLKFLKQCPKYGYSMNGQNLSPNTISCYFAILRNIVNRAFREGYLRDNPMASFSIVGKIKTIPQERPYLTFDEISALIHTPCPDVILKNAFLFSCMCGLRISDIRQLTWRNLIYSADKVALKIQMQKTNELLYLPLSQEALRWLPDKEGNQPDSIIFPLKSNTAICLNLLKWAVSAGINKHLTFHVARHTHATMMLTLGADLYTVSKLLGHKNINTTQIYAKIIDKKKDEAINLIPKFK